MVPRGTTPPPFTIRHLLCATWEIKALRSGGKWAHRFKVTAENSIVHPGKWAGLDLTTGRARNEAGLSELRARCRFESGRMRAVCVMPQIRAGDLFWVQGGLGRCRTRAKSNLTLHVTSVTVARLQDITEEEAQAEGVRFAITNAATLRDAFRSVHAWRYGFEAWAPNDWVWVVGFEVIQKNVDEVAGT